MSKRTSPRNDDGMALPLVIVFVVVIGAMTAALLGQAQTNFRTTNVTRNHQEKIYAANSALEYATQLVRRDPALCPTVGSSMPLPGVPSFGDRTVSVVCEATAGGADGPGGWGLFVTGQSGGGITTTCQQFIFWSCADAPKRIVGPVYNGGGWNLSDTLTVQDGYIVQGTSGACPAQPAGLRTNPTGLNPYRCSTPLAVPASPWSLAELAPSIPATAPAYTSPGSGCRVFSPGRYTTAPALQPGGQSYFRSGVYLLDNVTLAIGSGQTVVAGRPNGQDAVSVPLSGSCAAAQSADTGNGAVFLLAGNASVTGIFGNLAIYSYRPTAAARPPIAIYQLSQSEVTAWGLANAASPPTNAFAIGDFAGFSSLVGVRIGVNGAIYAPRSGVDMWMTNTMSYPLAGGVVARSFALNVGLFAATDADVGVRAGSATGNRTVRLRVGVQPKAGLTEKPILGTADVVISNDPLHSFSIISWRIDEDTNVSTPTP